MQITTHAMLGWLISQPLESRRDRVIVTTSAIACDLDGLSILAGTDAYARVHHTFGHNLFAATIVVVLAAFFSREKIKGSTLSAMAFGSHLLTDLLGSGADWPNPLFWPVSEKQFAFTPPFQWELASWQNFTIGLVCLGAMLFIGVKRGRTIVEVFSPRLDSRVVDVLRVRLGRFMTRF